MVARSLLFALALPAASMADLLPERPIRPIRPPVQTAGAGQRCAAGFCENFADCPHCADGLTCVTNPNMMCAGTCYGTCRDTSASVSGPCAAALNDAPMVVGAFVPQCDSAGNYAAVQCHGSTGSCWCADPTTGDEVHGTRQPPGGSRVTEDVCRAASSPSSKSPSIAPCHDYSCCSQRDECTNICDELPSNDWCNLRGACAPGTPPGCFAETSGSGNPECWNDEYTYDRCCAGPSGDATCWSGQYTYSFCCSNSNNGH